MRPNWRIIAASLLLAAQIALGGCELFDISDRGSLDSTNQEITFSLAEAHKHGSTEEAAPELVFSMRTVESFPCAGYHILHDVDRRRAHVSIRVLGIDAPVGICATVVVPASAAFELPLDAGTYSLVLENGRRRDRYMVVVTNDRVEFSAISKDWTEPTATLFWRYPPYSFGFYCGTLTETAHLCSDFDERLENLPLIRIDVPDEGRWPYALQSMGHYYDAPARFYRYPDESTWDEVKERLRTFTHEQIQGREGTGLEVRNWLADRLMSWVVENE